MSSVKSSLSPFDTQTESIEQLIEFLGENPNREGLVGTPQRAVKALQFLTKGYHEDLDTIINGALFSSDMDEMVSVKGIEFFSLCEHHLLPFIGTCHIAYIPQGKVLGLSKFARIVEHFSRRLQIQEQLTEDIANTVADITGAKGVGVIIESQHLCMMMRGVEKQQASMITSKMVGLFKTDQKTRTEFLSLVK
ncbi:MAG: GTP cyclohydrolase I FolE [Coxiellaceae bacterium]|nr:GTP cyclohydrolase I FolE [Coxiellaceae bacterium]|tara:strand:- start:1329 stop:1907 length:579 start_codon:yes stop_codon:yes gene_type:complete